MTAHPDIRKICVHRLVGDRPEGDGERAPTLKRITLELGGNDAGIVLDDVDPQEGRARHFRRRVPELRPGLPRHQAASMCTSRVYDEICDELVAIAKATVVDDGSKQGTKLGPLQNKMQYEKVKVFLEDARKNGNVIAGGAAMDRPGYFIEPTIVRDIKDGSRLVDEEQFGPVLPVIKYSDKDDAIRRANATNYGLGASVWSSDLDARLRGRQPDRGRHGVDQQASRHGAAYPVRRRQAVGHRHGIRRGRPGRIHPAARSSTDRGLWADYRLGRRRRRDPVSFSCNPRP